MLIRDYNTRRSATELNEWVWGRIDALSEAYGLRISVTDFFFSGRIDGVDRPVNIEDCKPTDWGLIGGEMEMIATLNVDNGPDLDFYAKVTVDHDDDGTKFLFASFADYNLLLCAIMDRLGKLARTKEYPS